jgi:hypothetical protein
MATTTKASKNSSSSSSILQQLVQSLVNGGGGEMGKPYLLLMQHSQSFPLRLEQQPQQQPRSHAHDVAVYRHAGLQTPAENAVSDWQAGTLWLEYLSELVLNTSAAPVSKDSTTIAKLVWLQTLPYCSRRRTDWWNSLQEKHGTDCVQAVDCCCCEDGGPFGWDNRNDGGGSSSSSSSGQGVNLERLDTVLAAVQKRAGKPSLETRTTVTVFVDSITPIVQRHGLNKAVTFLQRLQEALPTAAFMVVPVLIETLTAHQHRSLEDASSAVLNLTGGEAVLLRQGIREGGNIMVRERMTYRVVTRAAAGAIATETTRRVELVASADASKDNHSEATCVTDATEQKQPLGKTPSTASRHKKVNIQADEGNRTVGLVQPATGAIAEKATARATVPAQQEHRIFVQDDDIEFADYDEEDPDDDLDL